MTFLWLRSCIFLGIIFLTAKNFFLRESSEWKHNWGKGVLICHLSCEMSNIRDSINIIIQLCIDYIGLCSAKQDGAWCVLDKVWSEEAGDVQQESSGLPFDYGLDPCPGPPVLPQSHGWYTPFCCAVSKLGSNCLWVFVCTKFIKAILIHFYLPRMLFHI